MKKILVGAIALALGISPHGFAQSLEEMTVQIPRLRGPGLPLHHQQQYAHHLIPGDAVRQRTGSGNQHRSRHPQAARRVRAAISCLGKPLATRSLWIGQPRTIRQTSASGWRRFFFFLFCFFFFFYFFFFFFF